MMKLGPLTLAMGLLSLLVFVDPLAAAQKVNPACKGPTVPAKFRYLWINEMKDDSPVAVKGLSSAVEKWMAECPKVVRHGHGPDLAKNASFWGFKGTPPATSHLGDYGGWSDWTSEKDLRDCISKGLKSGTLTAVRAYHKRTSRLIFPLEAPGAVVPMSNSDKCVTTSMAPATVRFIVGYVLKDPTTAPRAQALQTKIAENAKTKPIRYGTGPRGVPKEDITIFGPGVDRPADWGAWFDFETLDDLRAYFTEASAIRAELRNLAAQSLRIAIPIPGLGSGAKPVATEG